MTTEDIKSALLLPDWLDCDLYEVVETVQKAFDWLGNGLIATPIGFRPWSGKVTAWYQENLYCDLGCLDCEYAYHHIDLETRPISGVFAVRRGAKVFDLVKESAGESFFPNEFKLINAL